VRASGSGTVTVVAAVIVLQIGVSLPMFLVSTLAPYLGDDIGLDARSLGLTVALFHGVSSLSAVHLGRLADTQAWQRGVVLAGAGLVVPLLLIWGVVDSVPLLVATVAAAALAQSLSIGTANLAVFETVPHARQGLVFGIKQAAVPVAMMLAGLTAPLVAARYGWRYAFLLAVSFPLVAVLLAVRARRGRSGGARGAHEHAVAGEVPPERRRRLRRLAAAIGFGSFTSSALGAFFVLFAVTRGMSPVAAGLVVAVSSAVNVLGRITVGWLADRRGADGFAWAGAMIACGSVGFAVLAFGEGWLLVAGAVIAYGVGWAWQGLVHLGAVRFAPEAPGYASGVIRTGMSAGAGTGPLVSGLLVGALGYGPLWALLAGMALASGVVVVLTIRRAETPHVTESGAAA
jgi:MFS family permease